ncbi:MAG: hypothetical protein K5694_06630 [Bacilli bacterium]|nr:hypothetical protein [Bacilli bacterium]
MNKRMRTILYVVIIVALVAAAFACYFISKDIYAQYSANNVRMIKLTGEELAKAQALKESLTISYNVLAVLAYVFSILALVAFGVCLHIADKLKEKEDEKVEAAVPQVEDDDKEMIANLEKDIAGIKGEEAAEEVIE